MGQSIGPTLSNISRSAPAHTHTHIHTYMPGGPFYKSCFCAKIQKQDQKLREYKNIGRKAGPSYMRTTPTVYSQHSHNWSDDSTSGLSVPISKGQRLIIIVHTGGCMRFVPGAFLMFKSNQKICVFLLHFLTS